MRALGGGFAHRCEQRTHGLRVPCDVDQAEHRQDLAQREVRDQQARERKIAETRTIHSLRSAREGQ